MKKTLIISSLALGCLALALGLVLAPKAHAAGSPSQTAQSVMVQTDLSQTAFEIVGDTTYSWNPQTSDPCAEGYYHPSGAWDTNTPTCTGGGKGGVNCAAGNQPTPPPAVADTNGPNSVDNHIVGDRCTFLCGGTLPGWSYQNTQTINGLNGFGSWTFTYNWTVTTDAITAGACWHCTQTGGTADIAFCGFVAGESFVKKNSGGNKFTTKYSFTLADDLGASRVIGATAALQKLNTDTNVWETVQGPVAIDTSTLVNCGKQTDSVDFCDGLGGVVDYVYYGNAGVFGNSAVYSFLHAPTPGNGDNTKTVTQILAQDNFANNDTDLCAYSQTAPFNGSFTVDAEGSYRIEIAGTVKGNSAVGDQSFDVTSTVTVGGQCTHECIDSLPPCLP